jgi:hypothetical protein
MRTFAVEARDRPRPTAKRQQFGIGIRGCAGGIRHGLVPTFSDTAARCRPSVRLQEAVQVARAAQGEHGAVRVGLTGLEVDLKAATAEPNEALFAMCPNVTIASERLRRMQDRCAQEGRFNADPTWCAVAVWRGSWEQPDRRFADAVMVGVALGNLPNPELPSETDVGLRSRSTHQTQRMPPADGAKSSGLFPPSNDARHPSKAPQSTPDAMFVRRNRLQ